MEVETFLNIPRRSRIILICWSIIVRILMLQENINTALFHKLFRSINRPKRNLILKSRKAQITLIKMILKVSRSLLNLTFIIPFYMTKFHYLSSPRQHKEEERIQSITKTEFLKNLWDKRLPSIFFPQCIHLEKKHPRSDLEARTLHDMIKLLIYHSYQFQCQGVQIKTLSQQVKFLKDSKNQRNLLRNFKMLEKIREILFNDQSQALTSFKMIKWIKNLSFESKTKSLKFKTLKCFNSYNKLDVTFNKTLETLICFLQAQSMSQTINLTKSPRKS